MGWLCGTSPQHSPSKATRKVECAIVAEAAAPAGDDGDFICHIEAPWLNDIYRSAL
jgi:hypothetical protein